MGLGFLGRGSGDAVYLAQCGADLIVTDIQSKEQLTDSLARLTPYAQIQYRLGRHESQDFKGRDFILKGAGIPRRSQYIALAEKEGIPVRMSADLFIEHAQIPFIGVTGTRGKTTTTLLIKAVFDAAGRKAVLGGNIRGVSSLALLQEVTPEHVAVMELDVWQLAGFKTIQRSPHIAVFTTFYPDHLSFYDNELSLYLDEKAHIFRYQTSDDVLIVGSQARPVIEAVYPDAARRAQYVSEDDVASWNLTMPGVHNRANAACARAACLAYGIDEDTIRTAIEAFPGVSGRLQYVRTVEGVRFYNDTTAVIPEATCVALDALAGTPTILIMGGGNKGNDTKELVRKAQRAKQVILLAGGGTNTIRRFFPDAPVCKSLSEAFAYAVQGAAPGDAVLLSPAFSSHGMFRDAYDRGDQFDALVQSL